MFVSLSMFRPRLALAALALVVALPASAQFRNAEAAIKYRQSVMTVKGNHLARVFAMANGQAPFDAKVAAENIEIVNMLSSNAQFASFWVDGSDKGNTRAKPEIWVEKDKFNAAVAKSQDDLVKLVAAGKSGNLDQIKTAAGAVGQSCKACHDAYQKPAS
jgi:cytochrome c556